MRIQDWYKEAKDGGHYALQLLIEFLVYEKKAIKWEDETESLTHYLQPKFKTYMNKYLTEYEEKRNG